MLEAINALLVTASQSEYPQGATPVSNSSAVAANAVATATLPAVANKTTYLTGFAVTGAGATGALVVTVTVANVVGGTLNFVYTFVAGVALANAPLIVTLPKAVPATAQNTTIVVSCPASGLGGTANAVVAFGYQL